MTNETEHNPLDILPPQHIAHLVQEVGVKKAKLNFWSLLTLGILAGAYISFGGLFYILVLTDSELGFGLSRALGGLVFSLGLILVILGGAELFTGNALIVISWAGKKVTTAELLTNWSIVFIGNLAGSLGMVILVYFAGTLELARGEFGNTAIAIATAKVGLPATQLFFRGILCNILVCMAVWMCFAAHSAVSKILAIIFPISAFVALGFEHSVANMFLLPLGFIAGSDISIQDMVWNLCFVTLGNIVGGGLLVSVVYWMVYIRHSADQDL